MATTFCEVKGIMSLDFTLRGATVNAVASQVTLRCLYEAIRHLRPDLPASGVLLLLQAAFC
jgi:hypothetical protein